VIKIKSLVFVSICVDQYRFALSRRYTPVNKNYYSLHNLEVNPQLYSVSQLLRHKFKVEGPAAAVDYGRSWLAGTLGC